MPDGPRGIVARLEVAVASVVIALAVAGLTLLPLLTPMFVRSLVAAVGAERLTGLSSTATAAAAEQVRRFVVDPKAPALPADIEGRPAFDSAATSHLADVRDVVVPAIRVTVVCFAIAALWIALRVRTDRGRVGVRRALRGAAVLVVAIGGAGVLAGLGDFDTLFAWFHSLFFAPGTWMFPEDALLIRLFPLPFWIAAAAVWGGLAIASAGLLLVVSRQSCFTHAKYGV